MSQRCQGSRQGSTASRCRRDLFRAAPNVSRRLPAGRQTAPPGGRAPEALHRRGSCAEFLVLLASLFVLSAILVRVMAGRPILLAERHLGLGGEAFSSYSFRTSSLASDHPRATWLASLRNAKVDRLPQLLSIVRGHMSFIGPPLVARDQLDDFDARPGLFGMSKAYCSGKGDVRRRAAFERYYVRCWSVWLDLALLGKAVVALK